MITNDLFNEAYNKYHANRTGFARPQRNDDERHDLDRDTRTWYIRLNGKLIRDKQGNPYSYRGKDAANKAAVNMQAKLFNQGKEFVLTTNPNDPQQGMTESTENRCMQCGMKNCSCPGDSCKCKPIAGWVPGKGFKKAVDEAANAAQQAAIAIAKKKEAGVDEGSVAKKPQPYNEPGWAKNLPKEKLDAIAGPRYKKDKKDKSVTESSQRVDSLVTDALRIMKGAEVSDAVSALKTVLGDREYNSRRGYYNFYIKQILDMYSQQGVAEGEGNFAGDTPVNIGGATVKRLGVGDTVTYFGRQAKIIGMSKTGNTSRITIANDMGGITQDVLTSDLKRTSVTEKLGAKLGTSRDSGKFLHKYRKQRGLDEFAPPGGDDREPDEEHILRQLAAMWWLGTEQQMAKAQNTLAAMGWEIGQDESGDDDAGVFVIRAGDEHGDSYIAFNHSDLELNEDAVADFLARGGKVQHGKLHKPRKGETWQGSSHIGTVGGRGSKGTVTGKGANTNPKSNKPVVAAEGRMTCSECGGPAFLSRFVAEENNACSAKQCSKQ